MFTAKFMLGLKKNCLPAGREKRIRGRHTDVVTEQVKKMLADQKLILMVRN